MGTLVAHLGDFDGDGRADLFYSYYVDGTWAAILQGPITGEIDAGDADVQIQWEIDGDYGAFVTGTGDVDLNGSDDFLVTCESCPPDGDDRHQGMSWLVLGPRSGSLNLSEADYRFDGEDPADGAGTFAAPAGDTNGDGVPDLLIGAPYYSGFVPSGGATYLISGADLTGP